MTTLANEFATRITGSQIFDALKKEQLAFWGEQEVPPNCLWSDIGRVLAQNFELISVEERVYIFSEIERALQSSDSTLATAVATGFLEAVDTVTAEIPALQKKIFHELGETAKTYLLEWWKWLGISPNL